jgi:mannose/cellobiose epimerase-like protein (N-acyl-D-glucosamine 2-epimerase family)
MIPLPSIKRMINILAILAVALDLQVVPILGQRLPPPAGLPTASDWKTHIEDDVMLFWVPAKTLGEPGNFPTYRCNDGSLFDKSRPCLELANPAAGIVWLDREYLRMKSRQVYGYGVAYQITGDLKYLELAKQGTDYIIKHGFQKVGDGLAPITFWKTATNRIESGPKVTQRTSQDMAYSLTGIAFYYYLTRDPEVLKVIEAVKDYIFKSYYDEGQHIMHWVSENYWEETTDRWELTAQLDQVYGYMIWLTPSLPVEKQSSWRADLKKLAHIMKERFYAGDCSAEENKKDGCGLFWGDVTQGHAHQVGAAHTDYGHSVKTMWMIYTVGKMTEDKELEEFGRTGAGRIIRRAYDAHNGSWSRDPLSDDKEWWIFCELDQTSLTLGLSDITYANYVVSTWKYWKTYMVDHQQHEVWHLVKADTNKPDRTLPKQHAWKNMMHSTEHALVGFILCSELYGKPVDLYFAWKQRPSDDTIHPYVYDGEIQSVESKDGRQKVTFAHIR